MHVGFLIGGCHGQGCATKPGLANKSGGVAAAGAFAVRHWIPWWVVQWAQRRDEPAYFACMALMSAMRSVAWQTMQVSVVANDTVRAA